MTYQKNTWRSYTQSWLSQGFTLIELLVVVLIIGILAAIAVPQYQKAVMKSRVARALPAISATEKAVDLYILENGKMPDAPEKLAIDIPTDTIGNDHFRFPVLGDSDLEFSVWGLGMPSLSVHKNIAYAQGYWDRECTYEGNVQEAVCKWLEETQGWHIVGVSGEEPDEEPMDEEG